VQPTADSYRSITHTLTDKHAEFQSCKPKKESNYRIVLKHMHHSINPDDLKSEIINIGHKVANIWNIKQYRTKLPLPMFFVDLKPAPNNKDILKVEFLQQCKIKFEPPRHKRETAQCTNCQRYGHTKNYCHLHPRCVNCAGDHFSLHCQRKDRSSAVRCVLCDGNNPVNYKGCTVYKDLKGICCLPTPQTLSNKSN
jgi:hypothetical protein